MIVPLSDLDDGSVVRADLVIVGGGPVGLTLARNCAAPGRQVLVLESGLEQESLDHAVLNAVESVGQPSSPAQVAKREEFHGAQCSTWSQEIQPFGVRCRVLGGSTHSWAGKSAPFDPIDFAPRDWVPHSGWPFGHETLAPYMRRAMAELNLCPSEPSMRFAATGLRSQYWQFARSRVDRLDVMRFGREFLHAQPEGVQILTDATVTHIALDQDGSAVTSLAVKGLCGKRARIEARHFVLAAGGIENPRLLLASNDVQANGIGNGHDLVGRYLMDHVGARVGSVPIAAVDAIVRKFGFFGVLHNGRSHMFMHGMALTDEAQADEHLLNAAVYFLPHRAADNPWDALKRLLRRDSTAIGQDILATLRGSGILAKGIGTKLLTDDHLPAWLKNMIVNAAIRLIPNVAADEFASRGVPHKLTGLDLDAICEQIPNPASRITLSSRQDRFGTPLAKVDWRIADAERRTLARIARLGRTGLIDAGLPAPMLASWIDSNVPEDCAIIDMGHTLGTTRMAASERAGVVDANCKIYGVANLYVAGGSVFATSGHANPTLMMLALSLRLADHLRARMDSPAPLSCRSPGAMAAPLENQAAQLCGLDTLS